MATDGHDGALKRESETSGLEMSLIRRGSQHRARDGDLAAVSSKKKESLIYLFTCSFLREVSPIPCDLAFMPGVTKVEERH